MITPDANILIYAYNTGHERNPLAKKWLEQALSSDEIFAFNWHAINAFLRIASHRRSFDRPYSIAEITTIVGSGLIRRMFEY